MTTDIYTDNMEDQIPKMIEDDPQGSIPIHCLCSAAATGGVFYINIIFINTNIRKWKFQLMSTNFHG